MIDRNAQRRGSGRALLTEFVRRLTLNPDVEMVTVSHRAGNAPMAALLAAVGELRLGRWGGCGVRL